MRGRLRKGIRVYSVECVGEREHSILRGRHSAKAFRCEV